MLGRVDLALDDFAHPGEDRVFVWDLARFMQLEPLIDLEPDEHRRSLAQAVFDGMRERRILISGAGRDVNVLKIRPPLAFDEADVARFLEGLAEVAELHLR